jgi:hypothetical protein
VSDGLVRGAAPSHGLDPRAATIRPATEADLPAIEQVSRANDDPSGGTPPAAPGAIFPRLRHLLARGTVLVAEIDGEVVGFGATVDTGRAIHLADLFVLPGLLGRGIGGRLIGPLFGDRWPRTTFASDDPRAMNLYVAAGMLPLWPNFYLGGDSRRLPEAPGLEVGTASADEVAAHEMAWTGTDRSADHAVWGALAGSRPYVVRASGRAIAAGHSRSRIRGAGRWLSRLVAAPDPDLDLVPPLVAALRYSSDDDGVTGACLIGVHPGLPVLLGAGFRILGHDTFMTSDPAILDLDRRVFETGIP